MSSIDYAYKLFLKTVDGILFEDFKNAKIDSTNKTIYGKQFKLIYISTEELELWESKCGGWLYLTNIYLNY